MKNLLIAISALAAILLASCQKENDDAIGGGNTAGTRLI
jgi:nitrous oxide reductase accessory protein NosL